MKRNDIPKFGPLQGVKVLICGAALASPVPGTLMAELGADVILVENPKAVDMYRSMQYGWPQERRNMRTISANMFSDEGKPIFTKLVSEVDILIEASRAGDFAKRGWSDEALWAVNPKLVITHISGFGQTAHPAFAKLPSYDTTGLAYSGYASLVTQPGEGPNYPPLQVSDYYTAYNAAYATLAAYIGAQRTGKGESVDISQYEATMRPMSDYLTRCVNLGLDVNEVKITNKAPYTAIFETSDGQWLYFYPSPGNVWLTLDKIGYPHDGTIPDDIIILSNSSEMWADYAYPALKEYCKNHTKAELEVFSTECKTLVNGFVQPNEMLQHPQYIARKTFTTYYDDTLQKDFIGVTPVPRMTNEPGQIWRGGPTMSMDAGDILEEIGFSAAEIEAFYANGTVKKPQ